MTKITDVFGKKVFNDAVMKRRLQKNVYDALQKHIEEGTAIEPAVADNIAAAMKDWAIENGATHFTHWFQPMTGITAEKHDSFIMPAEDGQVIMNFSGKELIKGEPDASSFPSGGIRATFEARGYTAWDTSSYVFIKDDTLCIPTAFCSYGGEALDKKTPLLLSAEAINKQALRVLRLLGNDASKVVTTVGPEQEYFLIPKELFMKRKDLRFCGRTLIGAMPPKSQELEDHYFGTIKPSVSGYMKDLNEALWELGVLANTEHNEVAPSQHELAPIFSNANIAADHNQLTMEMMKKVADKHDLVCLLHEKPFAGINGSGKHINWSMATDKGENLLKPGKNPIDNLQFLLFLSAVIQGVDDYQDLLRISVASAGNDHRLGGSEAPPAIISIFLGSELTGVLKAISEGKESVPSISRMMDTRAAVLADFKRDTTDRNRTSPFAFTGSRFEFRMAGSMHSISCPVYMLNTIVADSLKQYADRLEKADNIEAEAMEIIKSVYNDHSRILFDGNNYSEEWVKEAERRGLLNLRTAADAIPYFNAEKNVKLFVEHGIFSSAEIEARQEMEYEEYAKLIKIEALTLIEMINREIIPASSSFSSEMSRSVKIKKEILGDEAGLTAETDIIRRTVAVCDSLYDEVKKLEALIDESERITDSGKAARFACDTIIPCEEEIRKKADELERIVSDDFWPIPTYGDMLFS